MREDENPENAENPRVLDVNNIIVVLPSNRRGCCKRMMREDNMRMRVDKNAGGFPREC
jgi:hypothetical protein